MWEITIDAKLYDRGDEPGKVHPTEIKKAAEKIRMKPKQKRFRNYNTTVKINGARIFLVYQFHENNILYIKVARYARR